MVNVIVLRDELYGEIDVYDAKNPDRLLGFFSSEEGLKDAMNKNDWEAI